MIVRVASSIAILIGALTPDKSTAQDLGQLPTTVRAYNAERFQRGTNSGGVSAFEAFDWESQQTSIGGVVSMFPSELNRVDRPMGIDVVGIILPPVHLQNRGSRAVMVGIADSAGHVCLKTRIRPGGAESIQLSCGTVLVWHDTKQMAKATIKSGTTYEVYWGDDRWLVRDVSQDKQ